MWASIMTLDGPDNLSIDVGSVGLTLESYLRHL